MKTTFAIIFSSAGGKPEKSDECVNSCSFGICSKTCEFNKSGAKTRETSSRQGFQFGDSNRHGYGFPFGDSAKRTERMKRDNAECEDICAEGVCVYTCVEVDGVKY